MSDKPRVFVTGGSGFVGGRLIERLVAEGHEVRALARSDEAAARVRAAGGEAVSGDLNSVEAVTAGADGCGWAFHVAANTSEWAPLGDYQRDNVDGTRNVLEACQKGGVRRLVQVGTTSGLLGGKPIVNVDEAVPLLLNSPVPYGATKARAEQMVVAANRDGFETVVVRPHWIWGAGDTVILPRLIAAVQLGLFAWYGEARQLMSTTHVDNVVEGLMLGATRGAPGNAYWVTDGEPVVFRDFVTELLATQGVAPPTATISPRVAAVKARVGELAYRKLPLKGRPAITRFYFWVFSQECTVDDSKARGELGYREVKTREQGMAELRAAPNIAAAA